MDTGRILWDMNQTPYRFFHDEIDESVFREIHQHVRKLGKRVSVLDLGCGEGGTTRMLLPVSKAISAVDFSETAIRNCRKDIKNKKATFFVDGINSFLDKTKEKYDVIIACRSLYTRKPEKTIKKIYMHLDKSGIVMIIIPKKSIFDYSKTDSGFSPKLFIKTLVPRILHLVGFIDYNLVLKDDMHLMLGKYFDGVSSGECGGGTHYIFIAKK